VRAVNAPECAAAKHGTESAARNHGCCCPDAVEEKRRNDRYYKYRRARAGRPLKVTAIGSTRKLQALAAIGFSARYLAPRVPLDVTKLVDIRQGTAAVVRLVTHQRIDAVFEELCTADGPSTQARLRAARKGWFGPEVWPGGSIDNPGARPIIPEADRLTVTVHARRRGMPIRAIGQLINASDRTVRQLLEQVEEDLSAAS
jgi:hypothetical protein